LLRVFFCSQQFSAAVPGSAIEAIDVDFGELLVRFFELAFAWVLYKSQNGVRCALRQLWLLLFTPAIPATTIFGE